MVACFLHTHWPIITKHFYLDTWPASVLGLEEGFALPLSLTQCEGFAISMGLRHASLTWLCPCQQYTSLRTSSVPYTTSPGIQAPQKPAFFLPSGSCLVFCAPYTVSALDTGHCICLCASWLLSSIWSIHIKHG